MELHQIIELQAYPMDDAGFRTRCRAELSRSGALRMQGFVSPEAIAAIQKEGAAQMGEVFAQEAQHTVYLSPPDPTLPARHPRNRMVTSSKGCLTDDQIGAGSPLRALYNAGRFQDFLCAVLGEDALHSYADPLSSINLHVAHAGQELGWHFDNSSFAITLLIQAPDAGGRFDYVPALRDADGGEMGYDAVAEVLDGRTKPLTIDAAPGTLLLFRGRNALHRVTPTEGSTPRMLAVLAYNSKPGVSLSEAARMTFYGRVT